MTPSTFSRDEAASIDFLMLCIRESEAQSGFDKHHWKSLNTQLAAVRANDVNEVVAKLNVAYDGVSIDADKIALDILKSAIDDLSRLFKIIDAVNGN